MAKQQAAQKYIFKITTTRMRKAKWNLTLSLSDARKNDEMISLNDSLMLRWIDELNGRHGVNEEVAQIRAEIRDVRREPQSVQNRHRISKLYARLDQIQFCQDYIHLIIDRNKDMERACKGFTINGIKFVRLLGTSGGVKMSTIVFVNEKLAPILRERINNGRKDKPQIPAKLEAYRALTCSGSIPVSLPHGILVVSDCETKFKEDIIMLNDENSDEPTMEIVKDAEIALDESDGYGLMLPSLADRWSEELHLGYRTSGVNTRFSWEKGMIFCFDFIEFAEKVAGSYMVKDAWGHDVDIRNVELILTTSMLKLWDCYDSIEHYLACCEENHYTFGIAKTCPKELDRVRNLNYQFIQSYDLTDDQIDELIAPTMQEIRDVLTGDYRKAILFLRGINMNDDNVESRDFGFANALLVNPAAYDDQYIRSRILYLIKKRIEDAKIGVVSVHGNFSILCGDPVCLCQHIFGLPVTGLLKKGEIYSKYWSDAGATKVACFRAPMSCANNVDTKTIACNDEMLHWYQYMDRCTMINAWDSLAQKLNGADKHLCPPCQ